MLNLLNEIHIGDCLYRTKEIYDNSLDGVVIDPPYGENMGYEGDETIGSANDLLCQFLRVVEPKMKRNSHLAIFWTFRNLDVAIDAVRTCGFTYRRTLAMYIKSGSARPYLGWLPRTQAIVIAQKYLPKQPSEFHTEMAEYLSIKLVESKYKRSELAKLLNCNSRLIMKWTRVGDPAYCLPTPRFYRQLKELLSLDDRYDILLDRKAPMFDRRTDFDYQHDCYIVDTKSEEEKIHISQKPLDVVKHIVTCVCPENGIVLDGFSGSGTTALACKQTKRNFIAFELDLEYWKSSRERLHKGD